MLLDHRVHGAILADDPHALADLAKAGVDLEALTDDELGPEVNALMMAAKMGRPRMVAMLLALTDPLARNSSGVTAVHFAAIGGCPQCVALTAAACDPNQVDRSGETPLMDAARCLHLDCVEILLPLTAEPALASKDHRTAAGLALLAARPSGDPGLGARIAELIDSEPARREALAIAAELAPVTLRPRPIRPGL